MTFVPPINIAEPAVPARVPTVGGTTSPEGLRAAAVEFETVFLTEMLKHAGLGETRDAFGGGAGEEAFAGMLASEQARLIAERGGIGLADRIYEALLARGGADV